MSAETPTCKLKAVVSQIIDRRGVTPRKLGSDFVQSGHRVVSAKLMKSGRVDLDADEPRFVDESTYRKWMPTVLRAGDVLMTSEAPLGEVAYLDCDLDWCLGQRLFAIRANVGLLHGRYLYYALQTEPARGDVQSRATGTTVLGIRQSELWEVSVPTPSMDRQRAIAAVLGTLDDKIELNRRMSETLEAMARALFKSWFVNFDPVRAKMAGRDTGLPREIADLFPDRLVDSELGEIPDGWECMPLGALIQVVKGASYSSAELQDSPVALLSLKSFARGGGYRSGGLKAYVGRYKENQIVRYGDVVMPCTDVTQAAELIGRTARVPPISEFEIVVASTDVMVLKPIDGRVSSIWLYWLGRSDRFVSHMMSYSTGTTVLHLAREAVPSFIAPVPKPELCHAFERIAGQLLGRAERCLVGSQSVSALRDTLLPKLISGELRIPDPERFLKEVAA